MPVRRIEKERHLNVGFLVCVVGWVAMPTFAEAPLTLAEAMARARADSREIAAAQAQHAAAEERVRAALGFKKPVVRVSEQWLRTDSPADAFGLQLNQERFSFANFVAGNPNEPDPLSAGITRFEVEWPLYTGGEITTRIAQARHVATAADSNTKRTADRSALAAAEAWIRLAQAREAVALFETSRATVAAHVELARAYSAQGMLVRSDLLRAEVELARLDDGLAEARGQARVAEANLAFQMGGDLAERFDLVALGEPPALGRPLEEWLAVSSSRADLAGARERLAAGELEAEAQRAGRLPRVGLVARHDWVDDRPFGTHGSATTVAALATLELFDGGKRRAAIAAAESEAAAGRAELDRYTQGAQLETRRAFEIAQSALERRATAAVALDAAAETVRIVEERFRAGVVKTTDLLDSTTARREAEMRELSARAEAWLAQIQLCFAAGESPEAILGAQAPE